MLSNGFFQDQQAIVGLQPVEQLIPGIVRVGGADDYLQQRVLFPQVLNGLSAIPSTWHTHVDEG